jgi:HlyD family secretion protein
MKKVILIVGLVAVGAIVGIVGYQRVLASEREAALGELRIFGNIDIRDAQLAFFNTERIASVRVEEGDRVEGGDLLATLHTERLRAEIDGAEARIRAQAALVQRLENGSRPQEIAQGRAEVAAADARIANIEREIERLEATAKSGASSAQALDDAQARLHVEREARQVRAEALALLIEGPRQEDIAQARATLDAWRADLDLLNRRLIDSELRAPAKGVIQSRILEVGEMASPERPVFTLALTDPKWVRAWVPESDLGRIALGMRATIRSDSFGGRTYEGRVGFISPVAEFTPKSVETQELRTRLVYQVRVIVDDPADELRLGMPVTVDVGSAPGDRR